MLKKILKEKKYSLVDEKKSDGFTALHLACLNNYADAVKILIDYEYLNVNAKNQLGQTPLHLAVEKLNYDIIDLLIHYKQTKPNEYCLRLPKTCNLNESDKNHNTPMHYLIRNYSLTKLKETSAGLKSNEKEAYNVI